MNRSIRSIVVLGGVGILVAAGVLLLTGESTPGEATSKPEPAIVEKIEGTGRSKLVLITKAVERLGIQTTPIRVAGASVGKPGVTVIPYGALLYDAAGKTYVYTNPEPLVFIREPVTVDDIVKELVVLSAGPAVGTAVVSVGATELHGVEFGIGK